MRAFFQGWKRKAGLVTLLVTCLLMAGWLRNRHLVDFISYCPDVGLWHHFVLSPHGIQWGRTYGREPMAAQKNVLRLGWDSSEATKELIDELNFSEPRVDFLSNVEGIGFQFCVIRIKLSSVETAIWKIPYWSLVVPLTLLSAWLLLSKPGTRNPSSTTGHEPSAENIGTATLAL